MAKLFRYEMHAHTRETSRCSHQSAEEMMAAYARLQAYDGVVVTNHMFPGIIDEYGTRSWDALMDFFFAGYRAALAVGEKYGMQVLPGMEIRFRANVNDYLVYGMDEKSLSAHPEIMQMQDIKDFRPFCDTMGWQVYQAHPFRNGMTVVDPRFLHGIETFNGHPRHNSRNTVAQLWAQLHTLPEICGSDCHDAGDEGRAAMCFDHRLQDAQDLAQTLANGKYRLEKGPPNIILSEEANSFDRDDLIR